MFEETFNGVKKNFGFGCMRLNLLENEEVDLDNFKAMIDEYMAQGFNYFDTAHGYINYKSEAAIKECLVKRYPRDSFILTDKLSEGFFKTEEEILPLFEHQLERCGVDYFDYYLMHAQNAEYFEKYQKLHAYDIVNDLIKQGRVKHLGISFHDKADILDHILTNRPEIEVVQLQFNYLDYEDEGVQARKCYEVCVKHNKPVIVMEPVKGGRLVNLPKVAQDIYDELGGGSNASYAIRFAASFDNVKMVLSGMNDVAQMNDNLSYMKEFQPLSDKELDAVWRVRDILRNQDIIPCTACEYCVNECPKNIPIPKVFANVNNEKINAEFVPDADILAKAGECIKCGKCEHICPQKIEIRNQLERIKGDKMNKLVAYFSASGITKSLAEKIADKAGADVFAINPAVPYTEADVNWRNPLSRCNKEKIGKKDIPLEKKVENIEQYDTIYLGFPIWYWNAPNIVQTFLKEHNMDGKTIVIFATSGGSDLGKTAQTLQAIVPNATVKNGLLINDENDASIEKLLNI